MNAPEPTPGPRRPSRLSWRLLAAILPPVLVAVSGIVWLQYHMARREILGAINREAQVLSQRTAANIDSLLDQRYRDLFTLSETPLIADYYRNVDFGLHDEARAYRLELERYFTNFAARTRVYAAIMYLDAAGREVSRAGRQVVLPSDFLAAARVTPPGGWTTSRVEMLAGVGYAVVYGKPVHDELKKFKGLVVLVYSLAEVRGLLQSIIVGRNGRAYIVTADGVRIEGRPLAGNASELLRAESMARRMKWTVAVEAPQNDFLEPLKTVKNAAALTALVGLAALGALLLVLVRSITRPVAALAAAARRIGSGELAARVHAHGPDELGELSLAFNQMAVRLEEDRRLKGELQAQLIQAEKLSAIGQLISSVAHELNNPLAAISGYAQVAQVEDCPPRLREDLAHVYRNVLRCRKVVDNLLFFARQSRQERKRVDLNEAARSALDLLQYRLRKSEDVEVASALAPAAPLIAGDFQQIVQVLVNLIGNACDAMEGVVRYPDPKRLTLRTGTAGTSCWIEVEDNGPGIPEDARGKMFQAFFTTKEAGRGTGLGLSICRQIAQEHGGTLEFESVLDKGTTFRMSLPTARPEDLVELEEAEQAPAYAAVPGKRVLVADDEADIAELIGRVLREDGDEAVVVNSGAEALRLAQGEDFDLVVTDMGMEGVRGPDVYAALARRVAPRVPRALFITGDILNAKVLEFFSKTQAEYLVKPFDVDELRQTLRRLLGAPRA